MTRRIYRKLNGKRTLVDVTPLPGGGENVERVKKNMGTKNKELVDTWGMFTRDGNDQVKKIINSSSSYGEAEEKLEKLAYSGDSYGEARDTVVREYAWVHFNERKRFKR